MATNDDGAGPPGAASGPPLGAATLASIAREVDLPLAAIREALGAPHAASPPSVGHYRLGRLLGEGRARRVYEAEDLVLRRRAAVKILDGAGGPAEGRPLREARALARVRHPHVVAVFDVGPAEPGGWYVAMELCEGGALGRHVGAPVEPALARRWLKEAALGLREAHRQGILHRDIKPSNLLLDGAGRVKIGDFGAAKLCADVDATITAAQPGSLLGTPAYMAPEQARGEPIDARADLYALGATFYHLLAGRPPWPLGETAAVTLARRLIDAPEPLAAVAPWVPGRLCALVDDLLSRDPADRPADCDALLAALAALEAPAAEGEIVRAPAPRRWWSRFLQRAEPVVIPFASAGTVTEVHARLAEALGEQGFKPQVELEAASAWKRGNAHLVVNFTPDPGGARGEIAVSLPAVTLFGVRSDQLAYLATVALGALEHLAYGRVEKAVFHVIFGVLFARFVLTPIFHGLGRGAAQKAAVAIEKAIGIRARERLS